MVHVDDLDVFDRKILRELSADGRLSWRDLALRIGLSPSPTIRRVKRLEEVGFIKGYHAELDYGRLRGSVEVFVNVALERQAKSALERFEAQVASMLEVVGGFQVSGSFDYVIHAIVRDLDHYQALLKNVSSMVGIARIESRFVTKSFVRRAAEDATSAAPPIGAS